MSKSTTEPATLLKGGSLVDVTGGNVTRDIDIIVKAGRINDFGKTDSFDPHHFRVIDCTGKYLIPGLFDCHTHLCALTNQEPDVQREIHDECHLDIPFEDGRLTSPVLYDFVRRGVTQVRDLGGPVDTLSAFRTDIDSGVLTGPDIFYAGPMLEKSPLQGQAMNERWPGWMVPVDSEQDARDIAMTLHNHKAACIKTFGKFDHDVLRTLVELADQYRLPVTNDPGVTFFHDVPIDKGIELGITCFEHGKSPWPTVLKDELRREHDALKSAEPQRQMEFISKMMSMRADSISMPKLERLAAHMADRDIYFCPTLNICKFYSEKPEVFNDKEPEKYGSAFAVLLDIGRVITTEMVRAGVTILVGQDGYIPRFTLDEMMLLHGTGLSNQDILRGATTYPARWLGISDDYGTIDLGKKANIVILDGNPLDDIRNIGTVHTVLKGNMIIGCVGKPPVS